MEPDAKWSHLGTFASFTDRLETGQNSELFVDLLETLIRVEISTHLMARNREKK
jgi:hypothetical protein